MNNDVGLNKTFLGRRTGSFMIKTTDCTNNYYLDSDGADDLKLIDSYVVFKHKRPFNGKTFYITQVSADYWMYTISIDTAKRTSCAIHSINISIQDNPIRSTTYCVNDGWFQEFKDYDLNPKLTVYDYNNIAYINVSIANTN